MENYINDFWEVTLQGIQNLHALPRGEQAAWLNYYMQSIAEVAKPSTLRDRVLMKLSNEYEHLMRVWESETLDFHEQQMELAQQSNMLLIRVGEEGEKWTISHTSTQD